MIVLRLCFVMLALISLLAGAAAGLCALEERYYDARMNFRLAIFAAAVAAFFNYLLGAR